MPDTDIFRNYNFTLDLGQGVVGGYFTQILGLSMSLDVYDYREGGAGPAVRKLPGRVNYGDVTLRWGMTQSRDMWTWMMSGVNGNVERREISIILLAPNGQDEQTRWNLHNAFVKDWNAGEMNATSNGVLIESMVLTYEGLERG